MKGLPTCNGAKNAKVLWNAQDPTTGVNFYPWKEERKSVDSKDKCADDAIFVQSAGSKTKGTCYRYLVADAVCLLVDFSVNVDTATYDWEYLGGCFADNSFVNYIATTPGHEYNFDNIPI